MILDANPTKIPRRFPRRWANTAVHVRTETAQMNARAVNVSDGGICLFALANLSVGSEIELTFRAPRSKQQIRRRGTVRYRAVYLYGIEWTSEPHRTEEGRPRTLQVEPAHSG
jgi:hypothetical protein